MKMHPGKRIIAILLAFALVTGVAGPVAAQSGNSISFHPVENEEVSASLLHKTEQDQDVQPYGAHDSVRVSIILEEASTLEAGFETENLAANHAAMAYREDLLEEQLSLTARIEKAIQGDLDVVWNLTLAANIISANVEYGQIGEISRLPGVKKVVIERTYKPLESVASAELKPNMVISAGMTGANQVWEVGSYGAGTRVAVIDTGLDTDHQSFDPKALEYAFRQSAEKEGKSYEDYVASLHLLDKEEIAEKLPQLNLHKLMPEITAEDLYINLKAPFGINYIDRNKTITHDHDSASEHGSHVAGISSGNRFIPKDQSYVSAAESVYTLGNAPDSQIIVMKVFGENSPTDADYMAALEDAIMLDCDVANLSLGGSNPGGTISLDYEDIMESLVNTDTVVAIAAGNEGQWSAHASGPVPNLYVEDVSMHTSSEPSTFTNSLSVASVDNNGSITTSLLFADHRLGYVDGKGDWHDKFETLDTTGTGTEYDYVFLNGVGKSGDYAGIDVTGKIVLVSRGETNFTDKASIAVDKGAIATLVCNNVVDNTIMVLEGYWDSEPCAMISKESAEIIRSGSTEQKTESGVSYYTGKISVLSKLSPIPNPHDYFTMSAFSSWGVPGDLSMKPEISAPGGNIYSVNGAVPETDQYELMSGTSMATPQVAGISALVMERIRNDQLSQESMTDRALAQALMMSTADPMRDVTGHYISILQQGSGLANVRDALAAQAFITVVGQDDGKAKVELGDDPSREGSYTFSFDIHNLSSDAQTYRLSADLFTQDTFRDYANMHAKEVQDQSQMATYMSTTTRDLASRAVWSVNGQQIAQSEINLNGCDFDGNGAINEKDARTLLDYVTGRIDAIEHKENADLSGDGKIGTYDVHKFLAVLDSTTVDVPANDTIQVTLTLSLTENAKSYLDNTYPNGAYIQAYVYASGIPTEEGAEGTQLNIPVLGFYGCWTDPSMFELGSTQDILSGKEIRSTYTGEGGSVSEDGETIQPSSYNTLEVEYFRDPGYSYLLGGNPVDPEEIPNPIRTAINNKNGDRIHSYKFSPIRNAASSRVQITDSQGNVLWNRYPGPYSGAYYGIMMFFPMWINSNYRYPINFVPSDLAEGESFKTSITLAPEYNTNMVEEKADWDSLGRGATLSTTVTIDNTAPEIKEVFLGLIGNTLTVRASDNQYVAGVALFDRSGRNVIDSTGSIADAVPGDTDDFTLSLANANGKKFLVQVYDYAYNVSTYELVMDLGDPVPLPQLIAHDLEYAEYGPGYWTGFKVDSTYRDLSTYAKSPVSIQAATLADPYIYAFAQDHALYVLHKEDLLNPIRAGVLTQTLDDMAYSTKDGKIYAVYQDASGVSTLCTMDRLTGALTDVGKLGIHTNTLAVNAENVFYCNELGTSKVYRYTLDALDAPVLIGECLGDENAPFQSVNTQSMEYDPNTGNVVWISYASVPSSWGGTTDNAYLYEILPDDSIIRHEDLLHHLVALVIPDKAGHAPDTEPSDTATSLQLTDETVFLMKSQDYQLTADILPWNASDRFVYWESDNPDVVSVDGKGYVQALSVGTATITATSRLNSELTDSVTIHVNDIKVTVNGILQDSSGKPSTFSWDLEKANDWTADMDLDTDVMAATAKDDWTYFVTSGTGRTIKKVDYGVSSTLSQWVRSMNGLAYSPVFSGEKDLVHMICQTIWLPAKDLTTNADDNGWDLSRILQENNSQATEFIGIASGGAITYTETDGTNYDAELLYIIDDQGGIIQLYAYAMDPTAPDYDPDYPYNAGAKYFTSDLLSKGFSITYDENDNPLCSLITGDDGNLYFSGFNGNTSELYQLVFNQETNSYETSLFADMGEGVWPVALTKVTANKNDEIQEAENRMAASSVALEDKISLKETSENAVSPAPAPAAAPVVNTEAADFVIDISMKDTATTNGLLEVRYDEDILMLKGINGTAELTSWTDENGSLLFGYAGIQEIPAEMPVVSLTFTPRAMENTELTVITTERNQQNVQEEEKIPIQLAPEHPSDRFVDVQPEDWFRKYVDYVVGSGLMAGTSETTFEPDAEISRGQMIAVLYRLAGSPQVQGSHPFVDVDPNVYYASAVLWAYQNGISAGVTETEFAPNENTTRQQLVTFFGNYYKFCGNTVTVKGNLNQFRDANEVSSYAQKYMIWAVENKLIYGVEQNELDPHGIATRAQFAAILQRYCERFVES